MRKAADPETEIKPWVVEGVPLGIEKQIKSCNVFPPAKEGSNLPAEQRDVESTCDRVETALDNYASMVENEEDSKIEVERVIKKRFAARISKKVVQKRFRKGSASKMALIVKVAITLMTTNCQENTGLK